MCLRGPRLLVSCNVHVLWEYTCGNTCLMEVNVRLVEAHTWKYMHGSIHVKQKMRVLTRRNSPTMSITLHYINILLVDPQHNVTYGLFSKFLVAYENLE